jgi:predicted amidophosphoribosyltransferase
LLLGASGWSPLGDGLVRTRKTERQVGQSFHDRASNVSDAFRYSGPRLDGLTVALVDDVVTTGATMAECAAILKDAGASEVWALAFARASYQPGTAAPIEE